MRAKKIVLNFTLILSFAKYSLNQSSQVFGRGFSAVRFEDGPGFSKNENFFQDFSTPHNSIRRQAGRRVLFPDNSRNDAGGGNSGSPINFGDNKPSVSIPDSPSPGSYCTTHNGEAGQCHHYSECALFMPEYFGRGQRSRDAIQCQLQDGSRGLCCKTLAASSVSGPVPISSRFGAQAASVPTPSLDRNSIEDSIGSARIFFDNYNSIESRLLERNLAVKRGTSSYGHLLFFQTSKKAIELSQLGLNLVESTKQLKNNVGQRIAQSDNDIGLRLKNINVFGSSIGNQCPAPARCRKASRIYRTIDGSCNNLQEPVMGTALTPLIRLIRPQYADGIWSPRVGRDGNELPSARLLSSSFNQDVDSPNRLYSLWVMQFGQFLDHDLSHVPVFRYANGSGIECCTPDGDFLPRTLSHPQCNPIEIPSNDGFYRAFRQRCMNFVRSMVGPRSDCSLGYADQLNQITSYLDNSNVYGSSLEEHQELREFQDGKLKSDHFLPGKYGRKGMLPFQNKPGDECTEPDKGRFCFNAGDLRVNEMIGLTTTHLIWFREHNRIADELKNLNPFWSDEKLFTESRRILNAEYQHIIYNEWLPIIVGTNYMGVYGISPQAEGYYQGYDPSVDPGVSNAFAAAAFRMGHTLIQGLLRLSNSAGQVEDELVIHEHFNRPFRIREQRMVDNMIRALSNGNIQGFDRFITSEVTNRLFQEENKPFGMDLIALNIQRARDHGVPGYNAYRELCRLNRASRFEDFGDWISPDVISKLRGYYRHVDDVDLFVGGILESPLPGALLGPTFTCIIGDQFARARKGDRFAYDNGPSQSSFSPAQLKQIRRASFARILCDNSDDLQTIQPFAFLSPQQSYNPVLSCNTRDIPSMDLSYWQSQ